MKGLLKETPGAIWNRISTNTTRPYTIFNKEGIIISIGYIGKNSAMIVGSKKGSRIGNKIISGPREIIPFCEGLVSGNVNKRKPLSALFSRHKAIKPQEPVVRSEPQESDNYSMFDEYSRWNELQTNDLDGDGIPDDLNGNGIPDYLEVN